MRNPNRFETAFLRYVRTLYRPTDTVESVYGNFLRDIFAVDYPVRTFVCWFFPYSCRTPTTRQAKPFRLIFSATYPQSTLPSVPYAVFYQLVRTLAAHPLQVATVHGRRDAGTIFEKESKRAQFSSYSSRTARKSQHFFETFSTGTHAVTYV